MTRTVRWSVLLLVLQVFLFPRAIYAHPPSGIVVDPQGHVYFLFHGLARVESSGKIRTIQEDSGGHWLALDAQDRFSRMSPLPYKRIESNGTVLILAMALRL